MKTFLAGSLGWLVLASAFGQSNTAVVLGGEPVAMVQAAQTASSGGLGGAQLSCSGGAGEGWISLSGERVSLEEARLAAGVSGAPGQVVDNNGAVRMVAASDGQPVAAAVAAPGASGSEDIAALAHGLEYDPVRIFHHVRDHFEYVPYRGLLKGAELTLLEKSGNDMDLCALLIELFAECGIAAEYVWGSMHVPTSNGGHDMVSWLGPYAERIGVESALEDNGIPFAPSAQVDGYEVERVIVKAQLPQGTVYFDPALKRNVFTAGNGFVPGGYSRTGLLSAAGGTATADYAKDLSESGVQGYLDACASELTGWLETNRPNAALEKLLGKWSIESGQTAPVLPLSLAISQTWARGGEPGWYASWLYLADAHSNAFYSARTADVAGKKLSVGFNAVDMGRRLNPGNNWQFGEVDALGMGYTERTFNFTTEYYDWSRTVTFSISPSNREFAIVHPSTGTLLNSLSYTVTGQATIRIKVRFRGVGSVGDKTGRCSMMEYSTTSIDLFGTVVSGDLIEVSLDDVPAFTQTGVTGFGELPVNVFVNHPYNAQTNTYCDQWMKYNLIRSTNAHYAVIQGYGSSHTGGQLRKRERRLRNLLDSGLDNSSCEVMSESLNIIGQSWLEETSLSDQLFGHNQVTHHRVGLCAQEDGYYVDVKGQSHTGLLGTSAHPANALMQSAMEHAVLEQMQGSDRPAVSTVKLLKLANGNGDRVYRVHGGNFSALRSTLKAGGWSDAKLDEIGSRVQSQGGVYILPKIREISVGDWAGGGWIESYNEFGGRMIGMLIDGGLHGGYGANAGILEHQKLYWSTEYKQMLGMEFNNPAAADPVDMVTGAYLFDHEDFSIGGGWPLSFSRHYSSKSANREGPMGWGWTHSFNIYAQEHSVWREMLGTRTPEDAAATLLAQYAIHDLVASEDTPKGWLTAALTAQWLVDQLTDNAVSIYIGQKVMTFVEQPDGSYTPPPGMTVSLEESGGVYIVQERHGSTYLFDANLNLERIEDQHGNTLTFGYNAQTNLQNVASSFGSQMTFEYTGNLLTRIYDNSSSPREVLYQYDSNNNLTNFVDAAGFDWGIGYDSEHRVKWMKDPEQVTTIQNFYGALGLVTNQISSSGNPWDFHFNGVRNVSEDPLGNQTAYHLDDKQRTWSVEHPNGARTYTEFDGQNHPVKTTDARRIETVREFDVHHNLTGQGIALGLPEQRIDFFGYDSGHHLRFVTNAWDTAEQTITETTYTAEHKVDTVTLAQGTALATVTDYDYTPNGLVEQVSEGNGARITAYSNFDSYGNAQTVNSTDAGTAASVYDIQGNLKSQTIDGKTTEFDYDDRRLLETTTYAKGTADEFSTSQTYWKNGLLKTSTDGRGKTTHHYWTDAYKQAGTVLPNLGSTTNLYDAADRLVQSRDPEGNWATNTLDSVGRPLSVSSVYSVVTNQFDMVGNLTNSVVDPANLNLWSATEYDNLNRPLSVSSVLSVVQSQYDSLSRATNTVDAASKDWKTEYDELGRVKKTFRPSGNYEEYGYDALGSRTHFWNAEFKPMNFGVDAQGRVTSITNAIEKITSFAYDDAGNLFSRKDAEDAETFYGYNSLNRLVAVTNESIEVATFDHDANGNVTELTDHDSLITFGYDEMNRLLSSTSSVHSVSSVVGYSYDLSGNRTNIVYPGGLQVAYNYEADNRLRSVSISAPSAPPREINFGYDTANRLDAIEYPNGINSTFDHDAENRVTSIQHGSFVNRTIQRNALGFKKTELIDAGLKPTVPETSRRIKTHNDADQLVSEQVQTGGTNWTDVAYSYSENGCLEDISHGGTETQSFGYDYDNRLETVSSQQTAVSYLYDASGARIGRICTAPQGGATVATNYFVIDYSDGLKRPLAETDSSGNVTRYYVWSGSQLLCHIELPSPNNQLQTPNFVYYHADELGNTIALTDEAGTVTDEFAYMPYGKCTARTGTTQTPFQWLGGYGVYYDVDTKLHLTLHRAYSCSLKRFISADPLGIDGGVNVYAMANLNPLFFVDPYGLSGLESSGSDNWLVAGAKGYWQGCKYLYEDLNRWSGQILYGAGQASEFLFDTVPTAITGMDEYERFNIGIANGMNGDEFVYGALGLLTRGGRSLKWLSGIDDAIPSPKTTRWGPATGQGPLSKDVVSTFRGGSYTEMVTSEATTLYRVHGGRAGAMGPYWTRTKPAGPLQSRIDSALKPSWGNTATDMTTIRVPGGTTIFDGAAASQGGLLGGGSQVYIPKVDPSWIVH